MKTKLLSILSASLLLSASMISPASAQGYGVGVHANANAGIGVRAGGNATSTEAQTAVHGSATTTVHGNATSSAATAERGNATSTAARAGMQGNATSTNASGSGQITAEEHRSAVASFVQSLLAVADREGGIGAQVRVIARSQEESASTSANAIARVESRGGLQELLIGSDFRSLGELRSEMATTSANIAQLRNLLEKATSDADKAELSAQIQALEDIQANIEAFIEAHENSFSLFGWLAKLFAK